MYYMVDSRLHSTYVLRTWYASVLYVYARSHDIVHIITVRNRSELSLSDMVLPDLPLNEHLPSRGSSDFAEMSRHCLAHSMLH